ncbi:MAG: ATP-grasp domain-containing protein [Proteobacteria bacterium]|nr:ATP-grasp domain-containing protein [Pseudomonadota bacterium]
MFDKVLIANRGEIAIRIIHTCKRMGIHTVGVYSDADCHSPHRRIADEAVYIGGSGIQESYLNEERIISAALATGCRAVHPGYGFLSENARFARKVEAAGLIFVGPPAGVISIMSDKIAAKDLAIKAGIPVIPGCTDTLKDEDEALALAESIGYPVVLKPATGSGGKGISIVHEPAEMEFAIAASRRETRKVFGNSRIFMERFVEQSHLVDIQILADSFGNVVHLGERECLVQQQYKKIIAESPSPAVSVELRQHMGEAACNLARKAGYVNAGTVEFMVDAQEKFYFLEINNSLSVEHTVTELLTGLDLVELQFQIACGNPLPSLCTKAILDGSVIEAHVCAEIPRRNFIASTGIITTYAEPAGNEIRIDSGVKTGSIIDACHDSLLSKIICQGKDREAARSTLEEALNNYQIDGIVTNIDFINSLLCHPEFVKGNYTAGFIERYFKL